MSLIVSYLLLVNLKREAKKKEKRKEGVEWITNLIFRTYKLDMDSQLVTT